MIKIRSYRFAVTLALGLFTTTAFAQEAVVDTDQGDASASAVNATWKPSLITDGVYDHVPHKSAIVPWQPIREADVMWKKRVWREIDTRVRQNLAFRYPGDDFTGGGYFIEILLDAIRKGKVKAYSGFDDRFTAEMSKEAVLELLRGKTDSTEVYDPVTNTYSVQVTHQDFNPDNVTTYRIKEDVIFDRNLGRRIVRIIGIAPIKIDINPETGEQRGQAPMFWLYYPELRPVLAQYEVYNPENDVARITWDDFFENRYFSSRIIKMSNPFDQYIQSVPGMNAMEALYKSQEYNEMLFNKEHDMWVY